MFQYSLVKKQSITAILDSIKCSVKTNTLRRYFHDGAKYAILANAGVGCIFELIL